MRSKDQAKEIYALCARNAKAGNTLTYSEVLKYLGYSNRVAGHVIRMG